MRSQLLLVLALSVLSAYSQNISDTTEDLPEDPSSIIQEHEADVLKEFLSRELGIEEEDGNNEQKRVELRGCIDKYSACSYWASKGYCTKTYTVWMGNNCGLACKRCSTHTDCNCRYKMTGFLSGGCRIDRKAPHGKACHCRYRGAWTCDGRVQDCADNNNAKCLYPDTTVESCRQGHGDCGGY